MIILHISCDITLDFIDKPELIVSDIFIAPNEETEPLLYKAIWDTGSMQTSISQKIVSRHRLFCIDKKLIKSFRGVSEQSIYDICIGFASSGRGYSHVKVTDGVPYDLGCDVIVGMDIISLGDFHLRKENDEYIFTFKLYDYEQATGVSAR